MMDINLLGWAEYYDQHFEDHRDAGLIPARVAQEHKQLYDLFSEAGELHARVSGRFQHQTTSRADFPAVGDWVAVEPLAGENRGVIHALLPRRTCFSRKAVLAGGTKDSGGRTEEQVLAANVDTAFLVSGLDLDFNLRRIERFLSVAWDAGTSPVIVLNKADVCDDVAGRLAAAEAVAVGLPIHVMSAVEVDGIDELRAYLTDGRTAAFLGSSGVGKSTIINKLIGEDRLDTGGVRLDDSKGRHTTTRRELIVLPDGGLVIDTPGMREIQMWGDEEGLKKTFDDVEQLVAQCRFTNCTHGSEPGCAVQAALADGRLDPKRFAGYLRLQKEFHSLSVRKDVRRKRQEDRARDKMFRRFHKTRQELKRRKLI